LIPTVPQQRMLTTDTKTMHLIILTPDQKVFEGSVQKATFPGSAGSFQVLKDHAPLVSTLQKGAILYGGERQEHVLAIEKGLVEVLNNIITVLIPSATQH
jgi:F-type H+-transporting ATPase subunit epsilon